ncbi:hypothetical protein BaRGS_00002428, partial [Batillaria attramentaria]
MDISKNRTAACSISAFAGKKVSLYREHLSDVFNDDSIQFFNTLFIPLANLGR